MNVVEISELKKTYRNGLRGRLHALNGLDLTVPRGGVFGLLGPNGAGKTTTLRCLLGLASPTSGSCRLLGAGTASERAVIADQVGVCLDQPGLFPGFTAVENLRLLARMRGIDGGRDRLEGLLDQVGLAERGRSRVATFSKGMLQRLGLAAAMLKDPEVLILDEPTSGLDPAGFRDFRAFLRTLAGEGRTVVLSTHLLGEVQAVCERVAVLAHGRCLAAGRVSDLLQESQPPGVYIAVSNKREAVRVLRRAGFSARIEGSHVFAATGGRESQEVSQALAEAGIFISSLRSAEPDLEAAFFHMTEGGGDNSVAR